MGVDSEHLEEYRLADAEEVSGETASLANPLIGASEESCRGDLGIVCIRNAGRVGREHVVIVDLARNPALHEGDVLKCRDLYRLKVAVKPSVGVVARPELGLRLMTPSARISITYPPADIRGQLVELQMVVPPSSFS